MDQPSNKPAPFSAFMAPLSRSRLAKASRARNRSGMAKRFAERGQETNAIVVDRASLYRQQVSSLCFSPLEEGMLSNSLIAAGRDPVERRRLTHYANNIAGWLEYADRLHLAK